METKVKKKLPLYKLVINDENKEGIDCISLVSDPAIEVPWIAMHKQNESHEIQFAVDNVEQQTILGPVLIPGIPIFRRNFTIDENGVGQDAEVYFDAEDVESIVQKFFKMQNESNVDLEHNGLKINGAFLYQSFISDKANGINPKQFADLPDKTFYAKFKVVDPELWTSIKQGVFTGFSLAGFFDSIPIKQSMDKTEQELLYELYDLLEKIEKLG